MKKNGKKVFGIIAGIVGAAVIVVVGILIGKNINKSGSGNAGKEVAQTGEVTEDQTATDSEQSDAVKDDSDDAKTEDSSADNANETKDEKEDSGAADEDSINDGNGDDGKTDDGKTDDDDGKSDGGDEDVKDDDDKDDDGKDDDDKDGGDATEEGTPVENHGKLHLDGTQLVDKNGNAYQIQGVSTHGIAWFPEYVNYDAFKTLRDEWGANCVRLAMYSGESGGYANGGDQSKLKTTVNNGVDYATQLGMYVIIDWHVLGDCDPNNHKTEAISFFTEMSEKYADYDNVIYEICNEPNGGVTWDSVKSYAEEVIPVIKANDPEALIIVGTPTWSQDVDKAAANPITGYDNIMYALHFYADTHRDDLRNRMVSALANGLPIFVSEFGICDASGAGSNNHDEGNKWIETMNSNGISYCIWSLCNKNETASLISSSCSKTSSWTYDELSDSGKWYVGILGKNADLGNGNDAVDPNGGSGNDPSDDGSNGGQGGNPSPLDDQSISSGSLKVSVANTGSWNDGKADYYQFTITLKAEDGDVSGWTLELTFDGDIEIDQSWSGSFSKNGKTVTITPAEYNSTISNGGSCELGLIVYTNDKISSPSVTVK